MFFYLVCFTVVAKFVASGMLIEDLEEVFDSKNCIEASLVSLPTSQDVGVMIDSPKNEQIFENTLTKSDKSVISKIHELAQYNEIGFLYKLLSEEGPDHNKQFTVELTLGDETYRALGSSLKKAKQAAASQALANTLYEQPLQKIKEEKIVTPTVALNNVAMKLGFGVTYHLMNGQEEQAIDSYGASDEAYGKTKSFFPKWNQTSDPFKIPTEDTQISSPFTVKVRLMDRVYKGVGHTIQAARHEAALHALKDLEKRALLKNNVCTNDETYDQCKKNKDALKSPVSRVYEFAEKHEMSVEFEIVSEEGKPHKKIFITQCKLGQLVTEGEGISKKESKRAAAEKMLQKLPNLRDSYDENTIVNGLTDKQKQKKKKKKKKNKISRSEDADSFVKSVSDVVSSVWGTSDTEKTQQTKPKFKNNFSTKDKLLEVGNNLQIPVEFTDLRQFENSFYSVVTLGVRPPHICLGKAVNREKSHEFAAFHGLKLLQKLGVLEKTDFSQYLSDDYEIDKYLEQEMEEVVPWDRVDKENK